MAGAPGLPAGPGGPLGGGPIPGGIPDIGQDGMAQLAALLAGLLGGADGERPRLPGEGPWNAGPGRLTARLAVEAEVTQVIQTGPSNEVPLVALKDTVVRVSPVVVPGLLAGDQLTGLRVTGELVVTRGNRVVHRISPTRADGVRIGRRKDLDAALWDQELTIPGGWAGPGSTTVSAALMHVNCPLNFIVPAYFCRAGRYRFAVALTVVGSPGVVGEWRGDVTFHDVPAPRIVAVPVNWTDSAGTTWSPSDADMLASLAGAAAMLPFPYFETIVSAVEQSSSLMFGVPAATNDPGGCNPAWYDLDRKLDLLKLLTTLLGIGDLVVGFVPTAALPSSGGYVAGCGIQAIGSFVNDVNTLAHEFGHRYQCGHVRPVPGAYDTAYPDYGLQTGSIGYVGIDTSTSPPTLHDPTVTQDVMSYRYPRWTSPYTYTKIFDNRETHQYARADPARVRRLVALVSLRLYRDGRIDLERLATFDAAGMTGHEWDGATSPLTVDVLDGDGRVLAAQHLLHRSAAASCRGCGGGCGGTGVSPDREPWWDVDDVVELPDGAVSLSFHRGGEPLLVVEPGEAPEVELAVPERAGGVVRLRLSVRHPQARPTVVVLVTGDDGATWWPVAVDPDGEVVVPEERLPSRGRCRFRVVATAGLATTTVESTDVDVPPAAIRPHLVLPDDRCATPAGPVRLAVALDLRGLPAPAPGEVRWASDVDGDLGRGFSVLADLTPGRHTVTATCPDGLGGTLEQRGIIVVGG